MPTVLVYVDFLIAPHAQVLAGLEQYRQQHGLNWSIDVRTRSSHPPQPSPDAHVLTIHRRMLDFVKPVSPTRPALCLFGNSDAACHCCITLDGAAFGVLAARHFRDLGLRHAAYIPSHNPKIRQSLAPYYTSFQRPAPETIWSWTFCRAALMTGMSPCCRPCAVWPSPWGSTVPPMARRHGFWTDVWSRTLRSPMMSPSSAPAITPIIVCDVTRPSAASPSHGS